MAYLEELPRWAGYRHNCKIVNPSARAISYDAVARTLTATTAGSTLPLTVDYTPEMLPVRDQGSEGCCVAEASACMKEYQKRIQIGLRAYFAPQFLYDLRVDLSSSGMDPENAMQILDQYGCALEDSYPFGKSHKPAGISHAIYAQAANFKSRSYAFITSVAALKAALVANGVCILCAPIFNYSSTFWIPQNAKQEVITYHCVAVVGYDATSFIIRNSWGADWGNQGYSNFLFTSWESGITGWTTVDGTSQPGDYPTDLHSPDAKTSSSGCCILI